MRMVTERLKINKRDTQKDGIEYPNRVERVMMTSAGRPRLHPEIRPRMIPSHMVVAVATPTRMSVVQRRGAMMGATGTPGWYVMEVPRVPENTFRRYVAKRTMRGWARAHSWINAARRGHYPGPYEVPQPPGKRTDVGTPAS